MSLPPEHRLDLSGLKCPLPVLKIRKSLLEAQTGAVIEALCTDPMAEIDVPELAQSMRCPLLLSQKTATGMLFRIEKA